MFTPSPDAPTPDERQRFLRLLRTALAERRFQRLLLNRHEGEDASIERLTVRDIELRGERALSFLWRHKTKDVTKNHPLDEGLALIDALLGRDFQQAHLDTLAEEVQLRFSRKGKPLLQVGKKGAPPRPVKTPAAWRASRRPAGTTAPSPGSCRPTVLSGATSASRTRSRASPRSCRRWPASGSRSTSSSRSSARRSARRAWTRRARRCGWLISARARAT
ncbi:hypothetical protein ACQ859_26115 [Roseateles chitinivorans]|uniref:hypothetical protein n=1 Tax=Roseateles chitinivorans TaxID=2917965 RepID=UPI003D6679D6